MATFALAARAYQQSFDARPYTTLAITNGTLSALGDVVAQAVQIFVRLSSETFFFSKIQAVLNTPTRPLNQVNTMTDLCMTLSAHCDSLPLGSAWVSRLLFLSLRHPTPSPQSNSNSDSTPPSIIQVRSSDAGTNSLKRASPSAQKAAPSRRSAQACASVPSLSSPSAR